MHPSGWAGLLLSLLQGRGQKLDVPMPIVPLSGTPHHPGHTRQDYEIGGISTSELCPWSPPSTWDTGEKLCMVVAWHSVPEGCRAQLPDPWSLPGGADMLSMRNSPANPSPTTSALVLLWGDTKQNYKTGGVCC